MIDYSMKASLIIATIGLVMVTIAFAINYPPISAPLGGVGLSLGIIGVIFLIVFTVVDICTSKD